MKFELDYVKKLIKLMNDNSLTAIELDDGEKAISLKKEVSVAPFQQVTPVAPAQVAAPAVNAEATQSVKDEPKGRAITSPMVGTFYKAPSPDAPPFVQVGSTVAQGEVICIIEAMKLMNEIESEFSGKVVKICVEDGQPVEFGQVLMYIE